MTTSIRLEADMKARVAAAADRAGTTVHAFIRDAIAQRVDQAEQEDEFHRLADARWVNILATSETVGWDATRTWLAARSRGEHPAKPDVHKGG